MTTTPVRTSRRALVHGAAWSVPVVTVAAAAPAFAASPCVTSAGYRLDWGTTSYTRSSDNLGTASVTGAAGTQPVTVSFASAYIANGNSDRRGADNLTVPDAVNVGNLGDTEHALLISHADTAPNRNSRQTVTVTFSRAVTNLQFTITDVDSRTDGWWDQVELSGTRSATFNAAFVQGAGTQASPWRATSANTNLPNNSGSGNVNVTYPGPVTSFTLTFWSDVNGANQIINFSDFTFTASGC